MSISKSYNKQNGVTYVYEVTENYWDKEKKRPQSKRKLIGKIDPNTNEIIPTSRRKRQPDNSSVDYKSLYEAELRSSSKEKEKYLKLTAELKAVLMEEHAALVEFEKELATRRKAVENLLRKVKNYG